MLPRHRKRQDRLLRRAALALLAWTALGAGPPATAATTTETLELQPDEEIRRRVSLSDGDYLEVAAEQASADVELEIFDPAGDRLWQSQVIRAAWGDEAAFLIADADGEHEIRVRHTGSRPGRIELRISAGAADASQQSRAAAESVLRDLRSWRPDHDGSEAMLGQSDDAARAFLALGLPQRASAVLAESVAPLLGLGRVEGAIAAAERAAAIAEHADDPTSRCRALFKRAEAVYHRNAAEAVDVELDLVAFAEAHGAEWWELRTRRMLIFDLAQSGRDTEALEHHSAALRLAERLDAPWERAGVLLNAGAVYRSRGEVGAAIAAWTEARQLFERLGDHRYVAMANDNIAFVQRDVNDLDGALGTQRQALAQLERHGTDAEVALSALQLADTLLALGRDQEALGSLERSLEAARAAADPYLEALAERRLALIELDRGDTATACKRLAAALTVHRRTAQMEAVAVDLRHLGRCDEIRGDKPRAARRYAEAASLARSLSSTLLEIEARTAHAGLLAADQPEVAAGEIARALDLVESVRARTGSDRLRRSFAAPARAVYDLAIELALGDGARSADTVMRAFDLAERARARALLDFLEATPSAGRATFPADLRARERELLATAADVAGEIAVLQADPGRHPEELEILTARLARTDLELGALAEHMRDADPRRAFFLGARTAPVDAIRPYLEGAALLLYHTLEDRTLLFVLDESRLDLVELAPVEDLVDDIAALRAQLERPSRRLGPLLTPALRLWQELLAPALTHLEGDQRLLISADGPLHHLPFEALVATPPGNGSRTGWADVDFALGRWEIAYVPSGSLLPALRGAGRPEPLDKATLVVFADVVGDEAAAASPEPDAAGPQGARPGRQNLGALPASRREAERLTALFGAGRSRVFVGANAVESRVRELSGRPPKYLHFGTHGYVDVDVPALSALVLAPEKGSDGRLQAREIVGLELGAHLVTLAACETAAGQEQRGEGVMSLARAFLYSGASSVAATLWRLADNAAADLTTGMYRRLLAGAAPATALRQARLDLLRREATGHPYYWAPLVLVGDPGPGATTPQEP